MSFINSKSSLFDTNNNSLSIKELRAGLISGRWTSVDLVEMYLARINQFSRYNAMIFVKDRQLLLSEAASLDKERIELLCSEATAQQIPKLHGIPVVIKDNICTSDMPTTAGALALKDAESGFDAEIVRKLKSVGAIIIAKSNMCEFAGFVDDKVPGGWSCLGGQTLNANSGSSHPSGSSSGSACAAALGLAAATIGTETHSSIIKPSLFQSVVGFKPSLGLCSNSGIIPISTTFDTPGPICRSVEDVAAMMDVISEQSTEFSNLDAFSIRGARVGITLNNGSNLDNKDSAHITYHFAKFVFGKLSDLGCVVIHDDVVGDNLLNSDPRSFYKDCNTIENLVNSIRNDYFFILRCDFKDGISSILSKFSKIPSGVNDLKSLAEFNKLHPESLHPLAGQHTIIASKLEGFNYKSSLDKVLTLSENIIKNIFSSDNLDFVITTAIGPRWPLIYSIAVISGCPITSIPLGKHTYSDSYSAYPWFTNHPGTGYALILIGMPGDDHKLLCYAKQIENLLKV